MAIGFSPKYVEEYDLGDEDSNYFLVLALEAALKLNWDVGFITEGGFVAYTKFSMASWGEEITVSISGKSAKIKSECTGTQLLDWGKNKKNVKKLLLTIQEQKQILTPEKIETKLTELRQEYFSKDKNEFSKPVLNTKGKITSFFSIFIPQKGYFATPILIDANVLVFIIMIVSGVHIFFPEKQSMLEWGANIRPLTLEGQWWRLLTSCFIHFGIFHLIFNMYALLYIGLLLEPYLGKTRFITAYLLAGLAASTASLWWNSFVLSAGASGAIFGMYGVFLALLTTKLLDKAIKKSLLISIALFVGYNILNGLKPNSGIDNAAHIGGLLSGLIIGYAFVPSLKQYKNRKIQLTTTALLAVFILVPTVFIYKTLPDDFAIYQKKLEKFAEIESMAMEVYRLPEGTPRKEILSEIKDRGIYYWNENLKLIDSFKNLDLPPGIREKNQELRKYCVLRIKSYRLLYKAIKENTKKYAGQIKNYNDQIVAIIHKITEDIKQKK